METKPITNMELEKALVSAQFEYEYMGASPQEVAEKYGLPMNAVTYRIDHKMWEQKNLPVIQDPEELESYMKQVATSTQAQILGAQAEFRPLALQLEKSIRAKALQIVDQIDPLDTKAANKLATLEKVRRSLEETIPAPIQSFIKNAGAAGQDLDDGLTINILQQA